MSAEPRRILILDVLRAIAVFMVLIHHTLPINQIVLGYHWWVALKLKLMGWAGVDLFFVLSGFLIGGLLSKEYLKNGQVRVGRFLCRRAFKIYPPFYLMLICTFFWYIGSGRTIEPRPWLGDTLFLQNYIGRVWKHRWSLAVEEHFYIAVALFFAMGSRTRFLERPRFTIALFAAVLVTILLLRISAAESGTFDRESQLFATHMRLDALLFGTSLAYLWNLFSCQMAAFIRNWRFVLLLVSAACLAPLAYCSYETKYMHTVGFTINSIGFGIIILLGMSAAWTPNSSVISYVCNPLAAIGRYSYSIYLWHMAVYFTVERAIPLSLSFTPRYFIHFTVYSMLSVLIGVIMSRVVETPALRLRDRLFPAVTQ